MVIVYLLRFSKNDVPVMPVLVHVHIKYQIQHSLGIILLHTDHTFNCFTGELEYVLVCPQHL
ncbi:hypothetical protein T01_2402 [Trichinella spiralis]|uniref:Uncharacterized protein n=1 Tax=Trichinella spiralis TaxID=6334 RepID=A0A0V0YUE5_TRISP|nr:hypothetical protein T01_2402 [Trichinella spiralis]